MFPVPNSNALSDLMTFALALNCLSVKAKKDFKVGNELALELSKNVQVLREKSSTMVKKYRSPLYVGTL